MGKARVGVRLRESMGGNKSSNKSSDLTALTQRYRAFTKRIRALVVALKAQHESMLKMEASRQQVCVCARVRDGPPALQIDKLYLTFCSRTSHTFTKFCRSYSMYKVAKQFGSICKETPLFDCIGLMPSADRPSNTVCSYMSVHDDLASKSKSYNGKYQQFVLEYAIEWEKVICSRIDTGLKKAEELRIELDHYQKKTESLRLTANQNLVKGKSVPSGQQEKLTRNEEKLIASKQGYNRLATDLCILMEEVTERSWRDLHPLLVKVAQFDMTLANDEAKALASLNQVVASLKQVATENGLSSQPRLKDLATLKPELLSTRPGGVAGLYIEAGPSLGSTSFGSPTSSFEQTAMPPGSVGPQGMGGFPVHISSPSADPFGPRSHSLSSIHSPPLEQNPSYREPPSLNMLTIQAAPAPTIDDVYGFPSSSRSAPSSGNFNFGMSQQQQLQQQYTLPPAPSQSWNVRSSSMNDADFNSYPPTYGMPMSSPPPPPSMPPPPPPMVPPMNPNYSSSASPWSAPVPAPNPMSYYNNPAQPPPNPNYNPFGH